MLAYGFTPEEARELKKLANKQKQERKMLHQRLLVMQKMMEVRAQHDILRAEIEQAEAFKAATKKWPWQKS